MKSARLLRPRHALKLVRLLIGAMCVAGGIAQARPLQLSDLPLPAGARVSWVGQQLVHNGLPMQVQAFQANRSTAEVLNYYREQWAGRAEGEVPGYIENTAGGWQIISISQERTVLALQLKDDSQGRSNGYASIVDLDAASREKVDFPRPSGTQLVSSTRSEDPHRRANTMVFINSKSLNSNTYYFSNAMAKRGWRQAHSHRFRNTQVLFFEQAGKSCELSISAGNDGKTVIVANVTGV